MVLRSFQVLRSNLLRILHNGLRMNHSLDLFCYKPLQTTRKGPEQRQGFTLWELLLALGVLVILISMIVPNLQGVLNREKLKDVAEKVRLSLESTSRDALKQGEAYTFLIEADGRRWLSLPERYYDETIMDQPFGVQWGELPEGCRFQIVPMFDTFEEFESALYGGAAEPQTLQIPAEVLNQMGVDEEYGSVRWTHLALFQPEGTSEDVQLRIQFREEHELVLTLRGLTGDVILSQIQEVSE